MKTSITIYYKYFVFLVERLYYTLHKHARARVFTDPNSPV